MSKLTTIELHKENMKFSASHFTIFSDTDRENIHGHNYNVYVAITTLVEDNGLSFDYRFYKKKLYEICRGMNQTTLLPMHSKYMEITEEGDLIYAHYNGEKIPFLKRDVTFLPICNTTVEELSNLILENLLEDKELLEQHAIKELVVKVFSGPGQSGSASWGK